MLVLEKNRKLYTEVSQMARAAGIHIIMQHKDQVLMLLQEPLKQIFQQEYLFK